jgi:glucokinase
LETEGLKLDYVIGIDLGGTWLRIAIAKNNNEKIKESILRKYILPTNLLNNDPIKKLENIIHEIAKNIIDNIACICIAAAGKLDLKKSKIIFSPHSSIRNLSLSILEENLKIPIKLINDGVAGALAEWKLCIKNDNIVYIAIGTGIGGGIVVDGHLLIGKEGNAHEFGHMIVDINGLMECKCGGRGHWEAYTSGSGLPNLCKFLSKNYNEETPLLKKVINNNFNIKDIFEYTRKGDKFGMYIINEVIKINAMAIANLVNLYDPNVISIGGGVALKNPDLIIDPLNDHVSKYSFNTPPKIIPSSLKEETSLIGAILFAMEEL